MTYDDALQGLNAQFGLAPFPAADDGRHYYRFGEITIGLAQTQPGFLCARTWLGTVDDSDELSVTSVARANLRLPIAPEALLAMDGNGEVFLDQRIGGDELTHDLLLQSLERLIGEAQAWKTRLAPSATPSAKD